MKATAILIFSILAGMFLVSCESKNNSYSEDKSITGVTKLKLKGIFNMNISQGGNETMRISGNEELVKKLQVVQTGDLLELTLDEEETGSFFMRDELKIDLDLADLNEIRFEGVGNIKSTEKLDLGELLIVGNGVGNISLEFDARAVDARLSFVGNMSLKGSSHELKLVNDGVGNIGASELTVQNVNLTSSGIGAVSVHCEGELTLKVDGIGVVNYTGNPTVVSESVSGIGRVNRN
jgi:hypothetical protein